MNLMCILVITSALVVEIGTIISDNSGLRIETGDKKYLELLRSENILCRGCGGDVSSAHFLISKLSPSSLYAFNDTLFNREVVLVQVVPSDFIFEFPVITFTHTTCQGFGEWQVDDSWFPGYHWRPCICPDCGAFLGWVFEPIILGRVDTHDEIFCLILTSLIGQSFRGSRTIYCKLCTEGRRFFPNSKQYLEPAHEALSLDTPHDRIQNWLATSVNWMSEIYTIYIRSQNELQILWLYCPPTKNMASSDNLSNEDEQFLASCEELLKDRYTENDEEFMKVYNSEPSKPPIVESWWVPGQSGDGRRNDRRYNRRGHPYSRGEQGGYGGHSSGYGGQGGYGGHGGHGGYGGHSSRDGRGRHGDHEKSEQFSHPKTYERY